MKNSFYATLNLKCLEDYVNVQVANNMQDSTMNNLYNIAFVMIIKSICVFVVLANGSIASTYIRIASAVANRSAHSLLNCGDCNASSAKYLQFDLFGRKNKCSLQERGIFPSAV